MVLFPMQELDDINPLLLPHTIYSIGKEMVFGQCAYNIYFLSTTAPQDAHIRLVLQVYLGLNSLEFSAIRR